MKEVEEGFDACDKQGSNLSKTEVSGLCKKYGEKYRKDFVKRGRPLSTYKNGFDQKCRICGQPRNWCCC